MVTFYRVTQSTATSTPLEIEHLVMQVASCAPDRVLISTTYLHLIVVRLCVRADCAFFPFKENPMKLLPTCVGISRATLDLTVYQ